MDTLFYRVIHNKPIFNSIIRHLSDDLDNSTTTQNKHSCKWLIKNGFKTTLKYKIMNDHYLILDNFQISKKEEEFHREQLFNQQTQQPQQPLIDDKNLNNMVLLFKELIRNENNRKDEFEVLLKYFNNRNDDSIELYESLLKKYSNYFKFDIGNTIVQSAIFSNNELALQVICKELNYKITNKDLFQSIYFKKFNITKYIISINLKSGIDYKKVWEYIFKSLEQEKQITNSEEFQEYINLFEFIISDEIKSIIPSNSNNQEFKKDLTLKFFRLCCPIKLNIKLKLLVKVALLFNKMDLIKLSFPPTPGLLGVKHINNLSYTNQQLETGLLDSDTSVKSINKLVEFYYMVSGGRAYGSMYNPKDEDSILIDPFKNLMYYCKFGFNKSELKLFDNDHSIVRDVNLTDSLMHGNHELLIKQINYIVKHQYETNTNRRLLEELSSPIFKTDKFSLFKHCGNSYTIASKKTFINKIIGSPIDEWILFCLVVDHDDLELIKHTFDKLKTIKSYCIGGSGGANKSTKKQKVGADKQVTTQEDDEGEKRNDYGGYSSYLIYLDNLYSFVKSTIVLEFIYNLNFKKSRANLDLMLFQEKSDPVLLEKCEQLLLKRTNPIPTKIYTGLEDGIDIKSLSITSRIIKNPNTYSIIADTQDDGDGSLVYIYFESGDYNDSDFNDFKFVIQNYPTKKKFYISIPSPNSSNFNIKKFELDVFNFILNNINKFEISEKDLNLIKYCLGIIDGSSIATACYSDLELVFSLVSRYGDLNFIKLFLSNKENQQKQVIIEEMIRDSIRYGNLRVIQFVNREYPELMSPSLFKHIECDINGILNNCLKFNYLEIVKYLLESKLIETEELLKLICNNTNKKSTYLYINNIIHNNNKIN